MKIALISPLPQSQQPHSGVGRYGALLFERLRQRNADVYLIADKASREQDSERDRILYAWDTSARWLSQVADAIAKLRPDLVWMQHANFLYGTGLLSAFSPLRLGAHLRRRHIPLVLEMHDVRSLREVDWGFVRRHRHRAPPIVLRLGLRNVVRRLTQQAAITVVHDTRARAVLSTEYGVNPTSIAVVPHLPFPDASLDPGDARATLKLPPGATVFLFFGYASEYKGLDALLAAMQVLNRSGAGERVFLLLAAGKNPHLLADDRYLKQYASWQHAFENLPNARWDGFVPEHMVSTYFSAADAVILPYTEIFGSSGPLARAYSFNKPALVSSAIAADDSDNDLTFAPDAANIAAALRRFVEDDAYRQLLLRHAREAKARLESAKAYEAILDALARGRQ